MYACQYFWGYSAGLVIGSNVAEILLLVAMYVIKKKR